MSKSLNLKGIFKVEIKVRKDGLDSGLVLLKLGENLSNIRQELEKDSLINDTLLFAKGTSEIQRRSERKFLLNEIIKEIGDDKFINLKKNSKLGYDLKVLKDELKLEYGRKINSDGKIEIAEKNAFRLNEKDFKVNKEKEIGIEKKEVSSSEYNKSITELTLNGDISAHGFAKFGLSYGKSKNTIVGSEKKSICNYTYVNKISLKFKKICFEPTEEFKDEIKKAIKINDHRKKLKKFNGIIEEFGQFISNEVLIGGRAYSLGEEKSGKFSEEKNKNGSTTAEAMSSSAGITHTSGKSTETSYYSNNGCFILIGGKSDNPNNFDESAWVKSLDDFNNWACIEYKNPVSIFKLLPDDLYKDVFKSIGKRILYNDPGEDYTYNPNEKKKFELKNIPPNIADIIQKEDSECNIFATVIDTVDSKNDFFNCQILKTPDKTTPQLMIHCIQKNIRNTEYKLKIGLIIVGYDVNFNFINSDNDVQIKVIENDIKASSASSMECKKLFDDSYTEESICLGIPVLRKFDPSLVIGHHFYNYQKSGIGAYTFSYSLKENHYVKLPEFTFHMLIISNYPDCNEYKIIPFNCKNSFFDKLLSLKNSVLLPNDDDPHSSQSVIPKYISLHSSEDNCAPIFLKQKQNEIKIKCMKREVCENATCICKKTLKFSDLTFHYFKTQHENNWKILRA